MRKFGGPQALPGGAQPDPHPLYGGKGLSLGEGVSFVRVCVVVSGSTQGDVQLLDS
jgi:hypothetical protein